MIEKQWLSFNQTNECSSDFEFLAWVVLCVHSYEHNFIMLELSSDGLVCVFSSCSC